MFKLDPNSQTPLYMQIVEQTKLAIAAGYLQNGDKFPSVRELSKDLLINQTTVSKAFKELSSQGIIKTQPGIGTVVKLNQEKLDLKRDEFLEKEFDFSKAIKNPYAKTLKKQVTINLDEDVVRYFKEKSAEVGIPYQTLINLYLRDCVKKGRNIELTWK